MRILLMIIVLTTNVCFSQKFQLTDTKFVENSVFYTKSITFENCSRKFKGKQSYIILNKIVELLKNNPELCIEIGVHIDDWGKTCSENSTLSNEQAETIMNYFKNAGISKNRLKSKGYQHLVPAKVTEKDHYEFYFLKKGEFLTAEYINNLKDTQQKEIAHALNTRIEFKIICIDFKE